MADPNKGLEVDVQEGLISIAYPIKVRLRLIPGNFN